jgi:transposase InsO family protein
MSAGPLVRWYNEEHQHSGIGYVTPGERPLTVTLNPDN